MLAGGEVAACLVVEAVTRLVPGVMGNDVSPVTESFGERGLLEEPQFTRPATFRGWDVPEILRSGDHGRIERWRHAQALHRTIAAPPRPDRGPWRPERQRSSGCWKSSRRSRILDRPAAVLRGRGPDAIPGMQP